MEEFNKIKLTDYSVDDWIEMLYFKNYLHVLSAQELCEQCDDIDSYGEVLDAANIMLDVEPTFFLLDDKYIEKMHILIDNYRFQIHDSDFTIVTNEIIFGLNQLKFLDSVSTQGQKQHYLFWQEECRKFNFRTQEEFVAANANDILVYNMFSEGEDYGLPKEHVISSLNYFSAVYPEFFHDNLFYHEVMSYLDSFINVPFYKKVGRFYRYVNECSDDIKKVKKRK